MQLRDLTVGVEVKGREGRVQEGTWSGAEVKGRVQEGGGSLGER